MYTLLKIIHILSAALLFGTGLGTALYMYFAHRSRDVEIIALAFKQVVKGDWYFTLTSGIVQLVTGLLMIYIRKIAFSEFWIWGSLIGYFIAAGCWLPVVNLQIQLRNMALHAWQTQTSLPAEYYKKFNYWFWLGWPAFISLIIIFYLMANRSLHI